MGTRADFYEQNQGTLLWLGSVGWDGYDVEEMKAEHASKSALNQACWDIKSANTIEAFRDALQRYFAERDDVTTSDAGWPWPWADSTTTDRAYVFDGERTRLYAWGCEITSDDSADGPPPAGGWPNMEETRSVAFDKRSGLIVVGG